MKMCCVLVGVVSCIVKVYLHTIAVPFDIISKIRNQGSENDL